MGTWERDGVKAKSENLQGLIKLWTSEGDCEQLQGMAGGFKITKSGGEVRVDHSETTVVNLDFSPKWVLSQGFLACFQNGESFTVKH